jgi:hypothetical protein
MSTRKLAGKFAAFVTGTAMMAGSAFANNCEDSTRVIGIEDEALYERVDVTASVSGGTVTFQEQGGLGRTWEHAVSPYNTAAKSNIVPGTPYSAPLYALEGMLVDHAINRDTGNAGDASYIHLREDDPSHPFCHGDGSTRIVVTTPSGPPL